LIDPSEPRVRKDQVVYIAYRILDQDGNLHEQVDVPVGYVHGGRSPLFPQIEQALEGRSVGDQVEVTLSPQESFGPHRPELTFTDRLDNVPPEFRHLGAEAQFQNERGESITMVVRRIGDGTITLDGNHPLAGRTLTFLVTVTEIRPATASEIETGLPAGGSLAH
jgi:FKBP-type peptidyl-prolyl cis-trans isomerase SlyD